MLKYPFFFIFILVCAHLFARDVAAGLTAEQVLGQYWKDPLFGEAASETTIKIDLLSDMLWPTEITIPQNKNIRFVLTNKSEEPHLIAFTNDIQGLLADEKFKTFVADELYHSQQAVINVRGHSHSSSSVDDAESLVKTLPQRPTVFVKPNDLKEIIIRFDQVSSLKFACVMNEHHTLGFIGIINVIESKAPENESKFQGKSDRVEK